MHSLRMSNNDSIVYGLRLLVVSVCSVNQIHEASIVYTHPAYVNLKELGQSCANLSSESHAVRHFWYGQP